MKEFKSKYYKKRNYMFLAVLVCIAIFLTCVTIVMQKNLAKSQQAISDKLGIDGSQSEHSERSPIGFDTLKKG